jgi:hypothetical protein
MVTLFKGRQDAGDGALSETERAELAALRRGELGAEDGRAFLKNSIVGGRLWSWKPADSDPDYTLHCEEPVYAGSAPVAAALNGRPRKVLGWQTPAEVYQQQLSSTAQAGVATAP